MTGTLPSVADLRDDFDRIALLADTGWEHNSHYHAFLLRQFPEHCGEALEIGCGTGSFARLMARRADHVLALDLSPQMVRIGKERSAEHPNIEFEVADVTNWQFPPGRFDVITSIATVHHLPFETTLTRMASSLKPGGTLAVLDLYERRGLIDSLLDTIAVPASYAWRLAKLGKFLEDNEAKRVWSAHGDRDTYMTFSHIRQVALKLLPGSILRRHLLWRYSLVWQKPTTA